MQKKSYQKAYFTLKLLFKKQQQTVELSIFIFGRLNGSCCIIYICPLPQQIHVYVCRAPFPHLILHCLNVSCQRRAVLLQYTAAVWL